MSHDAVLLVSFGGPEGPDDVRPFLANVVRGRPVPPERVEEAARHYDLFGGVSPINEQNRTLLAALRSRFAEAGPNLRVYWGNRHWHPYLADAIREMERDGVRRALAFVTSAFDSYSGSGQYTEAIERARTEIGARAPVVDKLPAFFDHPRFIEANADHVRAGLRSVEADRRACARLLFTAHSIPRSMAADCAYEAQLRQACAQVAREAGHPGWDLAYQSRSGFPGQPWLEPDVRQALASAEDAGAWDVVVCPIGFVSDHMEVRYDLDTEARAFAEELGLRFIRTPTVSNHPAFVEMVRELAMERVARN